MTKRIEKAIDIFLDAINEGTLAKGSCTACAVGNLVGAGMGIKPITIKHVINFSDIHKSTGSWYELTKPSVFFKHRDFYKRGLEEINSTDFSLREIIQIENAFESGAKINYEYYSEHSKEEIRQDQINGLKAVVEVMMTFDDVKQDVNEVFTKKAEAIPL